MITHDTVLTPGEPQQDASCEMAYRPGFAEIRAVVIPWVGGEAESLEHVSVLVPDGTQADMFVSEWGHSTLSGRGPMPRNETATRLYRAASLRRDPTRDPETLAWIAGPAVLFHRRIWF